MTHVYNDPAEFKDDVIRGFAAGLPAAMSTGSRVRPASSGPAARWTGKVSLVIGGGSGHYPSYNGVVGTGFADGAVLGDLFASPSAEQVYRVARAANGGAGVVLGFGNYAGDRLNFAVAADRLRRRGHRHPDRLRDRRHRLRPRRRRQTSGAASPAPSPSTRSPVPPRRPAPTSTRSSG